MVRERLSTAIGGNGGHDCVAPGRCHKQASRELILLSNAWEWRSYNASLPVSTCERIANDFLLSIYSVMSIFQAYSIYGQRHGDWRYDCSKECLRRGGDARSCRSLKSSSRPSIWSSRAPAAVTGLKMFRLYNLLNCLREQHTT